MKRLCLLIVLFLAFFVSAQASNSVFNLVVDKQSICTATAVQGFKGERVLLTAGHCARGLKNDSNVFAYDVNSHARYPVRLLESKFKWSDTVDYAVFGYTTAAIPETSVLTTTTVPNVGDPVTTTEGPLGFMPIFVRGYYAGRVYFADDPHNEVNGMYWIQLPAAPGSSGSPVFDSRGRVWGILVGGSSDLPGLALVVLIPRAYGLGLSD